MLVTTVGSAEQLRDLILILYQNKCDPTRNKVRYQEQPNTNRSSPKRISNNAMILLQVGQAGIQSGQMLIDKLTTENNSKMLLHYPFNTLDQLCIDTERKVWKKVQNNREKETVFKERYIDHGVCGRANNWAFGYFGHHESRNNDDPSKDQELIMDTYRKMVESVYRYDGVLMLHSLAGGTGSGLGSRLIQEIRQEYGKAAIMTASFAPFSSGETAVQCYNSLLSLSILQEYADFIGYFSNDSLMACVERSHLQDHNKLKSTIKMNSLNEYAASCLMGHILPQTSVTSSSLGLEFHQNRVTNFHPLEFIYNLSPMPSCKYGLFSSSLSGGTCDKKAGLDSWDDIVSNMLRNIPILNYNDPISSRICLSSHLTLRGVQASGYTLWPRISKLTERWQSKIGKSILEPTIDFSYIYGLDIHSQKRSADTCFNSDLILQHVDPILHKAKRLYENKAYLHCYERYMVGNDCKELFGEAFESLEQVLSEYKNMNLY